MISWLMTFGFTFGTGLRDKYELLYSYMRTTKRQPSHIMGCCNRAVDMYKYIVTPRFIQATRLGYRIGYRTSYWD